MTVVTMMIVVTATKTTMLTLTLTTTLPSRNLFVVVGCVVARPVDEALVDDDVVG